MKKSFVKKIAKSFAFLLVGFSIFLAVQKVFIPKYYDDSVISAFDRNYQGFYELESNSIDAIFIGGSAFLSGIDPLRIWQLYGITSYNRSMTGLGPLGMENLLYEVFDYQSPKVVVLNVGAVNNVIPGEDILVTGDGNLRKTIDSMHMGNRKLAAIDLIAEYYSNVDKTTWIFPLLRYHDRWKNLSILDFVGSSKVFYLKGYTPIFEVYEGSDWEYESMQWGEELTEVTMGFYDRMISYCQDRGAEVILMALPNTHWSLQRHEFFEWYSKEREVDFLDFNEIMEQIGISGTNSFTDAGRHLNYFGAQVISEYLGAYLQNQYDIKNKKEDIAYMSWNEDYETYKIKVEREAYAFWLKNASIEKCVSLAQNLDGYISILVMGQGRINLEGEETRYVLEKFQTVKEPNENGSYYAIYANGMLVSEEAGTDMFSGIQYSREENGYEIAIDSMGKMVTSANSGVRINEDAAGELSGFYLIVYDKQLNKIVCSRVLD